VINTLITECIAWPITPPDFREKTSEYMVPPIGFEPTTPALRMLVTHHKINNLDNMLYSLLYSNRHKLSLYFNNLCRF